MNHLEQNDSHEQKTRVISIALITAMCVAGDSMLYIVLPLYWQDFGLTALWQIGILLSINRLVRLPLNPLIGLLYSKIQLRTGIFIAVLLTILTTLAYGFAQNFILLLCARAVWGLAWSLLRLGGYLTVIANSTAQNRGHYVGRYNGLWGLGGLIGMLSGGILIHLIGVQWLSAGLAAVALISFFLLTWIPKQKVQSEGEPPGQRKTDKGIDSTVQPVPWWKQPKVIFVLASGLMMAVVIFGIFLSTLTLLIDEHLSSLVLFGIVVSSTALSGILQAVRWSWDPFLAPWVGRKSDTHLGRKKFIIFALACAAIFMIVVTLPLSLWTFILCILAFQITSTMIVTLSDSAASDVATQSSKVGVMTSYTVAVDVGAAIGPLLAFFIIDLWGIQPLYWLAAFIFSVMALFWTRFNEHRNEVQLKVN